jgi:hypothetical protein
MKFAGFMKSLRKLKAIPWDDQRPAAVGVL